MREPTLSDRLVTAAMGAMPVEISNPRDAAAITVAVLRELGASGVIHHRDAESIADEIEHNAMERENDDHRFRLEPRDDKTT